MESGLESLKTMFVLFSAELQSNFLFVPKANSERTCLCCSNGLSITLKLPVIT